MIHICIPVHDEAETIGPLLWKLRKVFTDPEFRREFRIVVLDDASGDGTAATLERYASSLPLEIMRSEQRLGYGRAVDRLLHRVAESCDYPKRDAAVVLQADFTEDPELVADFARAIEGGADIVAGSLADEGADAPKNVRWARRVAPWILGRAHRRAPVEDPLCGLRAYRVVVVRKAIREGGSALCEAPEPWLASLQLLARLVPHARRIDELAVRHRHALRTRPSRFRAGDVLRALFRARKGRWWPPTAAALWLLLSASGLSAQGALVGPAQDPPPLRVELPDSLVPVSGTPVEVPFRVGEQLTYRVKLGVFNVGEGDMTVHGVEDIRGVPSYHVSMGLNASALFGAAKVRDRFQSWMDVTSLASRRFIRDIHEVNYKSYRVYEIYPEERRWERTDRDDQDGVTLSDLPMDEIAFIYWIRTQDLEVGQTYVYDDRYFKDDGNPVTLKVVRRERKEVDAGTFDTIVVQPTIRTSGLFGEGGKAELYFTDDDRRLLVYMRSEVPVVGSITLHLKGIGEL